MGPKPGVNVQLFMHFRTKKYDNPMIVEIIVDNYPAWFAQIFYYELRNLWSAKNF